MDAASRVPAARGTDVGKVFFLRLLGIWSRPGRPSPAGRGQL